ncbi:transmembrane protein, putative (macronuclear) [Tetrahymena thermophila SB210]|uniref:Transmembrane protein, putative n=1 Tax=Tetrahymena thermophila (strain SB210) TaxID=312017 RepID=Q23BQ0_TETTS|nr:transmembrane protein, putative [Tetrahymena thermophila SB210]EAR94068.2 transmembrane protein, putative [Tetrahymena thermophila SB210]|eukprot:XP_001014313.2 transmembrane protein, putative [Tetrahymena thermophila SB210]
MMESFKKLDIFPQPIQFNSIEQATKKKTVTGALLSMLVLLLSLSYFIYESYLYLSNQIDPIFRSQAFVRNDLINIPLNEESVAFQYIQYMIIQNQTEFPSDKTYISYVARFQYQNKADLQSVILDIAECKSPNLKGLLCVDFSKLANKVLSYDFTNNIASSVMIYAYKCHDVDQFKTTVPDNCASPDEIDAYISQQNYIMAYKIQQQQFNTTSKKMDLNYKNQFISIDSSQVMISEFKVQLQHTEIVEGAFVQQKTSFASPISFTISQYSMDYQTYSQNENSKYFSCVALDVDEQVFFTQIKYPTYPEVLAICNSTFALLMCLGYIARKLSFTLLKDQMLLMYMQNIYQGQYLNILQQNKILELNQTHNVQQDDDNDIQLQYEEKMNQIFIPNINAKQSGRVLNQKSNRGDFYIETMTERKQKDISLTESIQTEKKTQIETNFKINESEIQNINQSINQCSTERNQTEQQPLSSTRTNYNFRIFSLASSPLQNKQRFTLNSQRSIKKCKTINVQFAQDQNICQSLQSQTQINKENQFDNLKKKLNAYSSQQLSKNIHQLLFKFQLRNQINYQKSKGLNPKTKLLVEEQINKSLDFIHLQKEILFLKKAIMVLLSKDQFAMIPLIGCSEKGIDYIYNRTDQKNSLQDEKKLNHFEELLALSFNDNQTSDQINYFLAKCQSQEYLSDIDKRILSSII